MNQKQTNKQNMCDINSFTQPLTLTLYTFSFYLNIYQNRHRHITKMLILCCDKIILGCGIKDVKEGVNVIWHGIDVLCMLIKLTTQTHDINHQTCDTLSNPNE